MRINPVINPVRLDYGLMQYKIYKGYSHISNLKYTSTKGKGYELEVLRYYDLGFRIVLKKVKNANKSN